MSDRTKISFEVSYINWGHDINQQNGRFQGPCSYIVDFVCLFSFPFSPRTTKVVPFPSNLHTAQISKPVLSNMTLILHRRQTFLSPSKESTSSLSLSVSHGSRMYVLPNELWLLSSPLTYSVTIYGIKKHSLPCSVRESLIWKTWRILGGTPQ